MDSDSRRESVASGSVSSGSVADAGDSLPTLDDINTTTISAGSQDIANKMTSHLDKLDSLINKAERAELSMHNQNKEMRRVIKK